MGRREDLLAELAELDKKKSDVPLTVCICAGNSWKTINPVLEALWVQGVRMDVVTCSDASAQDPTRGILEDCQTWMVAHKSRSISNFRHIGDIPHKGGLEDMLAFAKRSMVEAVATEWVFFLDADVLLDPGTLRKVLDLAKKEEKLGALCVQYNHETSHEQWGATLMRADVAKEIGFSGKHVCGCKNLKKDLGARGLEMKHVEGITAQHLKWGQLRTVVMGG
jgi:hypothetical protein